ncbi:MAG TPA: alpha-ketoglutarate-dependent dioxygenase AlkB, partial [Verrucomicrobiae bacterium]|nr:alpha-ketoglutarate-dependent dioxygenase AlkB [Verrucomicrobiae bacterium]
YHKTRSVPQDVRRKGANFPGAGVRARDQAEMIDWNMKQGELFCFPEQHLTSAVEGFWLAEDYLSMMEEGDLLQRVEKGPWETDWKRRIQQYGIGYGGRAGGRTTLVRDFPDWLQTLAERVARDAGFERVPDNCVVNEYIPPLGIAPHKDYAAFGPRVACLSLGSDIVMDLLAPNSSRRVEAYVPARSLWVLSGKARTEWQHGIATRLSDNIHGEKQPRARRVSITFRTARERIAP